MGIIIMVMTGDPLEPRATLLMLLPMTRTAVDTAPEADPARRAAGIETETDDGEAAETTTMTTMERHRERELGSRSSSRDGAA